MSPFGGDEYLKVKYSEELTQPLPSGYALYKMDPKEVLKKFRCNIDLQKSIPNIRRWMNENDERILVKTMAAVDRQSLIHFRDIINKTLEKYGTGNKD